MNIPSPDPEWPESWRLSHAYDLLELDPDCRSLLGYSYAYRNRRDKAIELLQSVCPAPRRIIDVAAAQGNMSVCLADLGFDVYWNDLRAELFEYVQLKDPEGRIRQLPGNVTELNINEPFDAAMATEVIEHTAHPDEFLAALAKVVKPGGYVILTTPNGAYFLNRLPRFTECDDPSRFESRQFGPNSDDHIFLLHPDEMRRLAASTGLRVLRLELINNPLTNGHLKTGELLNRLPAALVRSFEATGQMAPALLKRRIHSCMAVLLWKPD